MAKFEARITCFVDKRYIAGGVYEVDEDTAAKLRKTGYFDEVKSKAAPKPKAEPDEGPKRQIKVS